MTRELPEPDPDPDPQPSMGERLKRRLGVRVDPEITLPFDSSIGSQVGEPPSSDVILAGLRAHRHAGTRYELLGEVARGGMGTILRAWDADLRRPLALKFVLGQGPEDPTGSAGGPSARTLWRFLEEAQITGQLDHPGIVPVHELGLDADGRLYFAMRLVHGRDLKTIFRLAMGEREGWTQTRALGVILKVCEAMAFAHAKGVIHRDLKPANVMVGRFGEVYVMDWGLARVLGREDSHDVRPLVKDMSPDAPIESSRSGRGVTTSADEVDGESEDALRTMDGEVIGTPAYMSPEQAAGKVDQLDARSDVYSVGAMLYHLLAGLVPFEGTQRRLSQQQVLLEVLRGGPPPLAQVAPHVPAELHAICDRAMARDPDDRYQDMEGLGGDLRAFLENRVVQAYRTGAVAELRKWIARNRGLAAAIAAAVLLSLAGVAAVGYVESRGRAVADGERLIAEQNAKIAEQNEEEARAQEAIARRERANVLRLSAFQDLEDLRREADRLWPAEPELADEMEGWLGRARGLLAGLEPDPESGAPGHRAQLAALDARAGGGPEAEPETTEERWWRTQLTKLVAELEAFGDEKTGWLRGRALPFGLGVERRLEFARSVEERSRTGAQARALWVEALAAIGDPGSVYGGLRISPQRGLLPLGVDPDSGLFEFAHLQSGAPALRGADGRLAIGEETGIVLVLLPEGQFSMGAQSSRPGTQNYDPLAQENERPVHEIALGPFFIAKYEATQSQWQRLAGANPSFYAAGGAYLGVVIGGMHPVEQVSWDDAKAILARARLTLPTEAQWEYAARAGAQSPWWTGEEAELLDGAANLLDLAAKAAGAPWQPIEEWLDDGAFLHAPVGSYAPNDFGLHDVAGNVWEWCLDLYGEYDFDVAEGTGLRLVEDSRTPVCRGGSFTQPALNARSADRNYQSADTLDLSIGLRPARALDP